MRATSFVTASLITCVIAAPATAQSPKRCNPLIVSPVGDLDPISIGPQILGGLNPFPGNVRNDDLWGRDPMAVGPFATGEYRWSQIDGQLQPSTGTVIRDFCFRRDNIVTGYDPFEATPRSVDIALSLGIGRYDQFGTDFDQNFVLPGPIGSTRRYVIGQAVSGSKPLVRTYSLPSLQQLLPPVGNGAQPFLGDMQFPFDFPYVVPSSSGGGFGNFNSLIWDMQVCIIHPRFGRYPIDANQTLDVNNASTLSGKGCKVEGQHLQEMVHKIFGTHQVIPNLYKFTFQVDFAPFNGPCTAVIGDAAPVSQVLQGLCTNLFVDPTKTLTAIPLMNANAQGFSTTFFTIPWLDFYEGLTLTSQAFCFMPAPQMLFASNAATHRMTSASPRVKSIFNYFCTAGDAFGGVNYGLAIVVGMNDQVAP